MRSDLALIQGVANRQSIAGDAFSRTSAVERWLFCCAGMIALMVILGGITRLTDSGLSIMEWAPIMGTLPPFTDAEWNRVFGLYQQIPQYQLLNSHMTLAEFKGIFWWEYLHRLWGRLLGLAFAVPLAWFLLRRKIDRLMARRLMMILGLGMLQGFIGWFMVASGFSDRISVSHYRLAIHLLMALALLSLVLFTALELRGARLNLSARPGSHSVRLRKILMIYTGWFAGVLLYGAFVAGLDAGLIYNTFPGMNGAFLPADAWHLVPAWLNFFDNPTMVQFGHRVLAITFVISLQTIRFFARKWDLPRDQWIAFNLFAFMATVQALMGIATLLLIVPIGLAVMHQLGAVFMVGFLTNAWHKLLVSDRSRGSRGR